MKKKSKKPIPLWAKLLAGKRDYQSGDYVYVKVLNQENWLKGKVLNAANYPDVYQWYIIKLLKFKGYDRYITTSHDKIKPAKKGKAKNVKR